MVFVLVSALEQLPLEYSPSMHDFCYINHTRPRKYQNTPRSLLTPQCDTVTDSDLYVETKIVV